MDTALLYKLNTLLKYLKISSPFYKDNPAIPDHIKNLEDFHKLSTTSKTDISKQTEKFLGITQQHVAEIVSTSGSTGSPLYIKMAQADLIRLEDIERHNFEASGFGQTDIVQIMATADRLFIAGLAYYLGLGKLNAAIIRAGGAPVAAHTQTITDLQVNALVGVPSLLIQLARDQATKWQKQITKMMLVGETLYEKDFHLNALGELLKEAYPNAEIFSSYGNTEIQGSFCDCSAHQGLHANENYFHVEILDEEGKSLPDYEIGELTVTTFVIKGMPLLRYRTGDLTFKISARCKCGNKSTRIGPILARKNQLLKIKGTTTYPDSLSAAIQKLPGLVDYLIIATSEKKTVDTIQILLHTLPELSLTQLSTLLKNELKFTPAIKISTQEEIDDVRKLNPARKKIYFLDNRCS